MSEPCVTVRADAGLEECAKALRDNRIRRVPVVDESGRCVGIVAQADLSRRDPALAADVVREVSRT
jgi:CBS domain-containing protein